MRFQINRIVHGCDILINLSTNIMPGTERINMSSENMKSLVEEILTTSLKRYQQDLEAIPAARFGESPGGKARSAADFTQECITLNLRFAAVLRKQELAPFKFDGWTRAEGDACNKELACAAFKQSADELLDAFNELDDIETEVISFRGPTPAYKVAHFAGVHINYHDAQLNMIQAVFGDEEVHWA
jgi:hypothetical protein